MRDATILPALLVKAVSDKLPFPLQHPEHSAVVPSIPEFIYRTQPDSIPIPSSFKNLPGRNWW